MFEEGVGFLICPAAYAVTASKQVEQHGVEEWSGKAMWDRNINS